MQTELMKRNEICGWEILICEGDPVGRFEIVSREIRGFDGLINHQFETKLLINSL